jgi:hypothetical protein
MDGPKAKKESFSWWNKQKRACAASCPLRGASLSGDGGTIVLAGATIGCRILTFRDLNSRNGSAAVSISLPRRH